MSGLQNENDIFSEMVGKAAEGCLKAIEKDFKLSSLLIPQAGHLMFVLFVLLRLNLTFIKLLKSETKYHELLQIFQDQLQDLSK